MLSGCLNTESYPHFLTFFPENLFSLSLFVRFFYSKPLEKYNLNEITISVSR